MLQRTMGNDLLLYVSRKIQTIRSLWTRYVCITNIHSLELWRHCNDIAAGKILLILIFVHMQ